jgi:serine/threonine protein phosphatase PrpC
VLVSLGADNSDTFVVLACDGVWDVLSNAEAAALVVADAATLRDRAGAVVKSAYDKGSTDNISVVVIRIEPSARSKAP